MPPLTLRRAAAAPRGGTRRSRCQTPRRRPGSWRGRPARPAPPAPAGGGPRRCYPSPQRLASTLLLLSALLLLIGSLPASPSFPSFSASPPPSASSSAAVMPNIGPTFLTTPHVKSVWTARESRVQARLCDIGSIGRSVGRTFSILHRIRITHLLDHRSGKPLHPRPRRQVTDSQESDDAPPLQPRPRGLKGSCEPLGQRSEVRPGQHMLHQDGKGQLPAGAAGSRWPC